MSMFRIYHALKSAYYEKRLKLQQIPLFNRVFPIALKIIDYKTYECHSSGEMAFDFFFSAAFINMMQAV